MRKSLKESLEWLGVLKEMGGYVIKETAVCLERIIPFQQCDDAYI